MSWPELNVFLFVLFFLERSNLIATKINRFREIPIDMQHLKLPLVGVEVEEGVVGRPVAVAVDADVASHA